MLDPQECEDDFPGLNDDPAAAGAAPASAATADALIGSPSRNTVPVALPALAAAVPATLDFPEGKAAAAVSAAVAVAAVELARSPVGGATPEPAAAVHSELGAGVISVPETHVSCGSAVQTPDQVGDG